MKIKALECYLPQNCLTNAQLIEANPEWRGVVENISSKTGVYKRPIALESETSSDLAFSAAEKLFKKKDYRSSIDFLLFCTQTPDYFLPATACILQARLKLPKSIGALDYNLGCSGYVYGLSLAKGLIHSGAAKNVLLLTGETHSKMMHPKDKSSIMVLGDGASATVVSNEGETDIGHFFFHTDGGGAENLILRNGAFRHKNMDGETVFENGEYIKNDNYFYMNGGEIFKFAVKTAPELVRQTLENNRLELKSIDLFVFHQANKYMLEFMRKIIDIPKDKLYIYLDNVGNTGSSTIPIALCRALEDGVIKRGFKVLIAGFGVGYSGCATVLYY